MALPLLALGAGALGSALGGIFGGNAADLARKRLIAAANTPGVDTRALTSEALSGMLGAIPAASSLGGQINQINAGQLAQMMESAMPGYAAGVGKTMGNIQDYLSGVLPSDVSQAVMRATAGTAIGRGLGSGTPLAKALTWRDLGRTSEAGIRYGMESMMRAPSAFPYAQPTNITGLLGPSPADLIGLRSGERTQRMNLLAQAAGMPGQTAAWGNVLGQLGGMGLGMGLQSLLSPKQQGVNYETGGVSYTPEQIQMIASPTIGRAFTGFGW